MSRSLRNRLLVWLVVSFSLALLVAGSTVTGAPNAFVQWAPAAAQGGSRIDPPSQLSTLCWVAYSPTNYDPNADPQKYPPDDSIRQDLETLRQAGFTGLVTYGSQGPLGQAIPRLAQEAGFDGLIVGVWDPTDLTESTQATAAATYPVTVGYVIGNEGLGVRYDLTKLQTTADALRQLTGKPVTTTEEIGDYSDGALTGFGDWLFPNAHPFFAGIMDPTQAVAWTEQVYQDLQQRTGQTVIFKEVGFPTSGDPQGILSEKLQAEYYRQLASSGVQFVYFEAFDQPWKTDLSVEPHWGLFNSDRSPKEVVQYVCGKTPSEGETATFETQVFNVYTDAEAQDNKFSPTGYMGDTGDIMVNEAWTDNPHSGSTAIQVTYSMKGDGPNECPYQAPCKWAGVYWQYPPDNWGIVPDAGYDLTGYHALTFWARSDTEARIEFKAGGITGDYPDSLQPARSSGVLTLTSEWKQYEINLQGMNLNYVIGGFVWATSWNNNGSSRANPQTEVFYLDDIRFEQ